MLKIITIKSALKHYPLAMLVLIVMSPIGKVVKFKRNELKVPHISI